MLREDYEAMCVLVREQFDSLSPTDPDRLRATARAAADLLGVSRVDPHTLTDILRRGRELTEKLHAA